MKPLDCPFVFVLWTDAITNDGWTDSEEAPGSETVWSTGFLLLSTKDDVRLASDVSNDDNGCNRRIAIPKRMIERIHKDSMTGEILYQRKVRGKKSKKQQPPQPNSS